MAKAKYSKGKDGYYRTKIWDGTYNTDGSKHRINLISKKSSGDLERKVNEMKQQVSNRDYIVPSDISLYMYAKDWLRTYISVRTRNTYAMYENIIEKHIKSLEHIKLQNMTHDNIQYLINTRADMPRTCQQILLTVKQVVRAASRAKLITPNFAAELISDIKLPKYTPKEKRALTALEIKAISTANFTDRERCFVYLIYACGLRREEALALTSFDISLSDRTLTVNKVLCFDKNTPYIEMRAKSVRGVRTIPMPDFLTEFLKDYCAKCPGRLITKLDGTDITASAYNKLWKSITNKMNLSAGGTKDIHIIHGLTAHVFRHNYCTNLCYQIPAISIKNIARLLGDHERMVLEVYNHIIEEKEDTVSAISNAIAL